MPDLKHLHKADHKHRDFEDIDPLNFDEEHGLHHKPDHKHHKGHHKKHHHKHKHHHKKHHHKHKHHHGSFSSEGSSYEDDDEYVAPPVPAEPKEDEEGEEPAVAAQGEYEAEAEEVEEAEAPAMGSSSPSKKKKKKKKKYNSQVSPNVPGGMNGEVAEEEDQGGGLSTGAKIAIGAGVAAVGAGAIGAGVMYHKKKQEEKKKQEAAAAAATLVDDPEDEAVYEVATDLETMPGSLDLYDDIVFSDMPAPTNDIDAAIEQINQACKGWSKDNDSLIVALATKSASDRTRIYSRFSETTGENLEEKMQKETKGDYGMAMRILSLPPDRLDVFLIREATKMGGTREDHLYPIIMGRSNKEINHLKKQYFGIENKDLGQLIQSELTGDFERLALACLQGAEEEFDPDVHTEEKAKEDAAKFYEAGQGSFGTDESGLFRTLVVSPPAHLKAINHAYADKYGSTLFKAFGKELHGITSRAAKFVLGMKLKPYETVAKLIKDATKWIGTDELQLTSCLVRYNKILPQVNTAYQKLYGKNLGDAIAREGGGDLGKLYMKYLESFQIFPTQKVEYETSGNGCPLLPIMCCGA